MKLDVIVEVYALCQYFKIIPSGQTVLPASWIWQSVVVVERYWCGIWSNGRAWKWGIQIEVTLHEQCQTAGC